ncbi:MAG TPA: sulfite exporter TauE/SafE family protein [Kiloniellales bacterium]|nr:sulfite exporter TauE/SafE family protein [Kiloniellales bacterium]
MDVYLPIAGISENVFVLFGLGGAVGLLSGLFGVGGGFLLTPLLILLGIPPPVAVSSSANQVVGASLSGVLAHWRRGNVDFRMGLLLIIGGLAGSSVGVGIFALLRSLGQIELAISIAYVVLLGTVGALMFVESLRAILRGRRSAGAVRRTGRLRHTWIHGLPHKLRFPRSRLYMSAYVPLGLGALVGILSAIMGMGGGFLLIPAMIYVIRMPAATVVGTSLFQVIFVTANVTFLQAVGTRTVDVMLALLLLAGGVIGAQLGSRMGTALRAEHMRIVLALLVIAVSLKVLHDLTLPPIDTYYADISAV